MKRSLRQDRLQALEQLGVNARPEKGEVADVAMILAAGAAGGRQGLGLDDHVDDLFEPFALASRKRWIASR